MINDEFSECVIVIDDMPQPYNIMVPLQSENPEQTTEKKAREEGNAWTSRYTPYFNENFTIS